MLVVDTSAVVAALLGTPAPDGLVERLAADSDLHAPHLVDVELLHVLRRLVARGELSPDRAVDARQDIADLTLLRYPHEPLADRMWDMRENLTAYDAAFVALAEVLQCPLITCDARLAGAPAHAAEVLLFE